MLPPLWQKITLFNPVVYLVNGFRWSFYGVSDVNVTLSVSMTIGVHAAVPRDHHVDVPHGLQAQELTSGTDHLHDVRHRDNDLSSLQNIWG